MEKNIVQFVEEAQRGSEQAFEVLFEATKNSVYYTCLALLKNEADAKDIMQETYITSFQKIASLTEPDKYAAWVYRIAVNKCKDVLVARKAWIINSDEADDIEDIPDTDLESLPESYIIQKDKRRILLDIMKTRLSDVQYRTILLFYFDDLSIAEIAALMDCSENTVKSRLHLAKAKLKEGITMYEEENKDKLYAVLPFLARFFHSEAGETAVPPVTVNLHRTTLNGSNQSQPGNTFDPSPKKNPAAETPNQAGANTANQAGAGTVPSSAAKASGFFASTGAKIAAAILGGVLVFGGIAVGIQASRSNQGTRSGANQTTENDAVSPNNNNADAQTVLSGDVQSETQDENTPEKQGGTYEGDALELYYELDDINFTIKDVAQGPTQLSILTSDNIAATITSYSGILGNEQQVSPDAVGLVNNVFYLVKSEDNSFSLYRDDYTEECEVVSADNVICKGMNYPNICYATVSMNGDPMIFYLDGTTLMYTDGTDKLNVPIYLAKEDEPVAFYPVRDVFYGDDASFFILLENNEVYNLSSLSGISVSETESPEPDAAKGAIVNAIYVYNIPRITDVAKIYAAGSMGWNEGEVIYEKVGDSGNIYAYNFLSEELNFSIKLPEGYTTADVVQAETSQTSILVRFSDGSVYLAAEDDPAALVCSEELSSLNRDGHILKIVGGNEMFFLMDDHQLYNANM